MLTKVEFKPGIVKDDTALAAEGAWIDSDKVRFWRGRPQTIGGWQLLSTETFDGIARAAHDWTDLEGNPVLAWATANKLYALVGGAMIDITPLLSEGVLAAPFSTTNGSGLVTVAHPLHGLTTGARVTFTNAAPVGGLDLNGTHTVTVLGANTYRITAGSNASSTVTGGGGTADYTTDLPGGNVDGLAIGYGSGDYGEGPYGATLVTDFEPRIWSLDNWGENLLANPRGQGLYEWQPSFTVSDLVLNGDFATTDGWVAGTGWTIASGAATKTAGTDDLLSQNVQGVLEPGRAYRLTFTATVTAGSVRFRMNAGDPAAVIDVGQASSPITQSGTYSRLLRAPQEPVDIVFEPDTSFAGSIDSVSIKLETRAYRIDEAPRNIDFMFVDPNRLVVALSTQEADGDYSPLLVRWSDQENNRSWVTGPDNLAGEFTLAKGGRALSGLASRQQNLVWTDDALYSMQFTGTSDTVFSFKLLGTGCGIVGRNAAIEHNGIAFWLSRSGFYVFQGAIPQRIDCPIERDVLDNLADLQTEKVFAGINGRFSEVWWLYPDARDGLECSRVAAYNYIEQHWVTHSFDRSAWLAAGIFPHPVGFATNGLIYAHETSQDANGNPIATVLRSSAFDVEDGGNLMIVKEIIPDFEDQACPVTFDLSPRLYPNAAALPVTEHVANPSTAALRMRRKGRQISLALRSTSAPTFWRLGALRLNAEKAGAKR